MRWPGPAPGSSLPSPSSRGPCSPRLTRPSGGPTTLPNGNASSPPRAAAAAAAILAMTDAHVDGSFYYHLWDQVCFVEQFRPFFRDPGIMYRHWNEVPHRFGLFGVGQEVRPQYFVYLMLGRLTGRRVRVRSATEDLRVLAAKDGSRSAVLL